MLDLKPSYRFLHYIYSDKIDFSLEQRAPHLNQGLYRGFETFQLSG